MNLPALRANWRTSLSGIGAAFFGLLTILAAAPYELGDFAAIIPPEWKAKVAAASAAAAFALRVWNSVASKDAVVVGNGTLNEPVRVPSPRGGRVSIEPLLLALFCLPAFTGCAHLSPETKSRFAATGQWLAGKATTIALNTVLAAAQSQADASNKADWMDSLATGLRAQAVASFSGDDVRDLVGIWTPARPHWQDLGAQLAALAQQATTLPPEQRAEFLARALNDAAAAARRLPASAFAPPSSERLEDAGGTAPFPIVITRLGP